MGAVRCRGWSGLGRCRRGDNHQAVSEREPDHGTTEGLLSMPVLWKPVEGSRISDALYEGYGHRLRSVARQAAMDP